MRALAAIAALALLACRTAGTTPTAATTATPTATPTTTTTATPTAAPALGREQVLMDGVAMAVHWSDGDTFRVRGGPRGGQTFRLEGYNTLESYGPVHRWGRWTPEELLALTRQATRLVRSRGWSCRAVPGGGGYGRELASCPDAARALVESGLAMVFAVGAPPDPLLLETQRQAQARGAGMWAGGVPPFIPSSLHAAGEPDLVGEAYDRVVDTRTGRTEVRRHGKAYATCQEVCTGSGAAEACMRYVPMARRYRDRPDCLLRR